MKKPLDRKEAKTIVLAVFSMIAAGCSTPGRVATDISLTGGGALAGYELSHQKVGGALAGAAVGYIASKVTQSEVQKAMSVAEQRGYDRALNQAVKQQYWVIQNQQKSREGPPEAEAKLVPVVVPATQINGVVQCAHVEYIRLSQ